MPLPLPSPLAVPESGVPPKGAGGEVPRRYAVSRFPVVPPRRQAARCGRVLGDADRGVPPKGAGGEVCRRNAVSRFPAVARLSLSPAVGGEGVGG